MIFTCIHIETIGKCENIIFLNEKNVQVTVNEFYIFGKNSRKLQKMYIKWMLKKYTSSANEFRYIHNEKLYKSS